MVPEHVVLAWPEFELNGQWLSLTDLFGSACLVDGTAFTNAPGQTLFEAVASTRVSWTGGGGCDLSGFVRSNLGYYDNRDELYAEHGQTLRATVRLVADPVMSRWSSLG